MASLFVIRGSDAGKHFLLDGPSTVLGREATCTVPISDHEVSRQHASVSFEDGAYVLRDLGSSNGTFVNGQRVDKHTLRSGDRLQLGRSLLVYTSSNSEPSTETDFHVSIVPTEGSTPHAAEELSQIRHAMRGLGASQPSTPTLKPSSLGDTVEMPEFTGQSESGLGIEGSETTSPWETLYRTVLAVSRTLDIDQLLKQILDFTFQGVACDRGCILLQEESSQRLKPVVHRNRHQGQTKSKIEISQTILDYVMKNREGVLTSNARDDQRWQAGVSIVGMGIREAICVPMLGRYGIVGAIYIDTSLSPGQWAQAKGQTRLNEQHLQLMIAIGHQAALAIEDTFYYRGMVQAERLAAIGQTIATLSHHIKNILQGISGGSYLVQEGIRRQQFETVAKGWKIVEKNQERISTLVMDMLTYSKDRTPVYANVALPEVVEDCLELIQPRLLEYSIALDWILPDAFPSVSADVDGIHRAILNVLTNAVDAIGDRSQGCVKVRLRTDKDRAVLDISDNGPGIEAEDIPRIFSLFESTKGILGTGLGLPVSQKILREHGGDIFVTSRVGEGSCFSLTLPLSSDIATGDVRVDPPTGAG